MFDDPRDVLLAPVISEKSYGLLDENKYTFDVHPSANKTQIKIAVEKVFNVKVTDVNTLNRQGKRKRTRFGYGTAQAASSARSSPCARATASTCSDRLAEADSWLFASTSRRPRAAAAPRWPTSPRSPVTTRRSRWSARCTTRVAATTPARSPRGTRAAGTSAPTG